MGNKRKLEIITISSDDDDDDIPLKLMQAPSQVISTLNGLKALSVQQCEFCDEAFLNKYDMLIHNAKHIIIPLLKQQVNQCMECLLYFSSHTELTQHLKNKHNISTDKKITTKICTIDNVRTDKKVKINHDEKAEVSTIEAATEYKPTLKLKDFRMLKVTTPVENLTKTTDKISSRLRFEDDIDTETTVGLLNDLTKECKVNMNLFDEPWLDTAEVTVKTTVQTIINTVVNTKSSDVNVVVPTDKFVDVETVESSDDEEVFTESTHYDDLVKPGVYKCKRCQEIFTTRFQLAQHDTTHIRIRKPRPLLCEYCDRYISTSRLRLRQHMVSSHSPALWEHRQRPHTSCDKCGLKYYNYKRHAENYHELVYCHLCHKGFDTDEERLDHIRTHLVETKCMQCDLVSTAIEIDEHQRLCHRVNNVSTIKICETCCLFVKNKHNMQYVFLKTISEIGTRLTCERCDKKFFELKLVRRLHKSNLKEKDGVREKKCLSNTARLKNIQQRLKMINKLSRF